MSELVTSGEGQSLIELDEAKRHIALAREMAAAEELHEWRDRAAAMLHYSKMRGDSQEAANQAAEIKVRAEAALGALDAEAKPQGIAETQRKPLSGRGLELGVSNQTRANWRKLGQLDEEKLDEVIATVRELDDTISTAAVVKAASAKAMGIHYSSATDEWATPLDFYEVVNQEFKFELDVCALPSSAKCERYFTPEDDGLAQNWNGRVWMNPPYGTEIVDWIAKAHQSSVNGTIVAALVPARVDTNWWWDHCRHAEIRFLRGRLKFGNVGTAAPFPSALVIFGREPKVVWWEWKV